MLVVREFFLEILLSDMQTMSNLVSTWLKSIFNSFILANNDEIFNPLMPGGNKKVTHT